MEPVKNNRPPWVKWYKTAAWRKLRLWQLKREPLCRFCKAKDIITEANTVDHVNPHRGNIDKFFSRSNLCSLCKSCHSSIKQKIEKSGEFGCDERGFVSSWR